MDRAFDPSGSGPDVPPDASVDAPVDVPGDAPDVPPDASVDAPGDVPGDAHGVAPVPGGAVPEVVAPDLPRHTSRITLRRSALKRNLAFLRSKIGPDVTLSSVVKANAFGHGIGPFSALAESLGVRHFSVASSQEAAQVRAALTHETSVVMIMGILHDDDLPWVIAQGVHFFVFDVARLHAALSVARALGRPAHVHLEVETGGNRTGLTEGPFREALQLLRDHPDHLRFAGLATHYAGIEALSERPRTQKQLQVFHHFDAIARAEGLRPAVRHTACSAAALAFPDTHFELVRVGTAQYGFWPSPDVYRLHLDATGKRSDNPLRRVLRWHTRVMDLKDVAKGEYVGYGKAFRARKPTLIAVLPVGYGDGYPRAMSNRGHVLIRGRKAPVRGLVNMNVTMVDVSHVPDVQAGDEAVLVGRQGRASISVASFAEVADGLNNEFVSRLPAQIPRSVVP